MTAADRAARMTSGGQATRMTTIIPRRAAA